MKALRPFALLVTASLVAVPDLAAQDQSPPRRVTPASTVFLGGVRSGTRTNETVTITVLDAMNRALEHNLGVLTAEEQLGHARGTRWRELSALLPNVNARVSETRLQNNLQAFGFGSFGSAFANVPTIVGPFNVFDARVYLSQSVFDLGAVNHTRSESHNVNAAQYTYQGARDLVVWVAGTLYLQALAADARVESARAQQQTAQTLYNQAGNLRQSGLVAGIDVLRSEVQLNVQINRATTAANDAEKAKLQLARVIGLPLGQRFLLDPALPELPNPDLTVDQAIERAYQTRADYQAALERVRAGRSGASGHCGRGPASGQDQRRFRRYRSVAGRLARYVQRGWRGSDSNLSGRTHAGEDSQH